jgi:hypothetical protein
MVSRNGLRYSAGEALPALPVLGVQQLVGW